MKFFSQDFFMSAISTQLFTARCTIVPVEEDGVTPMPGVTIVLTAPGATQEGNSIIVPLGTTVSWTATKDGYQGLSGSVTVNGDIDKKITLVPIAIVMWTYTIVPTPSTAAVQMNSSDGTSSNTGTITVPEGSTVTWSVSNTGMNSATGSRLIPQDSSESSPIVETVVLTANLSIAGVTPNDARVEWRAGVGDPVSGLSLTNVPVNNSVTLRIYKDGYNDYTVAFPRSGATYITTEQLEAVSLTPKYYTFSISANPTGATIKLKRNNGEFVNYTTNATITDCVVGDTFTWVVEKQGFVTSAQGSYTMGAADYTAPTVTLEPSVYNVQISVSPASATITLTHDGQTISNTGSITLSLQYGTAISYQASYLGTTSELRTAVVYDTYSDSITLTPPNTVEVITENVSNRVLTKGNYVAILVGGGSAGVAGGYFQQSFSAISSSVKGYGIGGTGGNGGGSGYVKKLYFSANGTDSFNFVVGSGGQRQKTYMIARITSGSAGITTAHTRQVDPADSDTSLNGTPSYILRGSTEIGRANGGSLSAQTQTSNGTMSVILYGGIGGNAGGIGGGGQRHTYGSSATAGADGQGGAKQGKNSKRTVTRYSGQNSTLTYNFEFAGQIGSEGTYDTNTAAFNSSLANPGLAGGGLSSYASSLDTAQKLDAVSEATLLNNMSGGGAGSSGGAYANATNNTGCRCGGPGGGGGSWTSGNNATIDSSVTIPSSANPWYSGKGGNGVILLACLAWT